MLKTRKRTRMYKGKLQYRYGGYVVWGREIKGQWRTFTKEVEIWGSPEWDPDFYSPDPIFDAIEKKAKQRWKLAECCEVWRC